MHAAGVYAAGVCMCEAGGAGAIFLAPALAAQCRRSPLALCCCAVLDERAAGAQGFCPAAARLIVCSACLLFPRQFHHAAAFPPFSSMFATLDREVKRLHGVAVEAAELESTMMMLAHGLDLFYTRLTPSRQARPLTVMHTPFDGSDLTKNLRLVCNIYVHASSAVGLSLRWLSFLQFSFRLQEL